MSAEDLAKVLTAFGASGIATIVTAVTTLIVNRYNWKRFTHLQGEEAKKEFSSEEDGD